MGEPTTQGAARLPLHAEPPLSTVAEAAAADKKTSSASSSAPSSTPS